MAPYQTQVISNCDAIVKSQENVDEASMYYFFAVVFGAFLFWMLFFSSGTKFFVNTYYGREFFKREIYRDLENLNMQARQHGNLVPVQSMPFSGIYDTVFNFENEECYSSCEFVFAKDPEAQIFWQEKEVVGTNVNWTGRAFRSFFRGKKLMHEEIDGSDPRFGILCKTNRASLSFIRVFDIPIIYNLCYNASEKKQKNLVIYFMDRQILIVHRLFLLIGNLFIQA